MPYAMRAAVNVVLFTAFGALLLWRARRIRKRAGDIEQASLWDNYCVATIEISGYVAILLALLLVALEIHNAVHPS